MQRSNKHVDYAQHRRPEFVYGDRIRRLTNDEYPLLVQLNWSKHDREGKFVLKLEYPSDGPQRIMAESIRAQNHYKPQGGYQLKRQKGMKVISEGLDIIGAAVTENGATRTHSVMANTPCASDPVNISDGRFRRGWSFRRDKHASPSSRRGPLGCAAAVGWSKEKPGNRPRGSLPESSLNCLIRHQATGPTSKHSILSSDSPLPDSTFTRTINNPEKMMQRKRQRTLEAKLLQLLQHGEPDLGGTLKIYGDQICPQVPYRTLLLSVNDTVATVIRQCLDKYGLEDADPDTYCLLMRVRSATDTTNGLRGTEEILTDTDCPLSLLFASAHEPGSVVTFELRTRPPHLMPNKRTTSDGVCGTPYWNEPHFTLGTADSNRKPRPNRSSAEPDTAFACLIEMNPTSVDDPVRAGVDFHPSSLTGNVYPLPVHKGHVCIGTAPTPDTSHPYVVTLPISQWPGVELHHLIIWRPPVPHGVTSAMAAAEATQRRGGWLACRPCIRPSIKSGQAKQFNAVYVNNHLLTASPENQGCVYWLSPGDILRLGNGRRCLKIWPGNGSVLPRFQSKPVFCTASLPSPLIIPFGLRTPLVCPEVPKHQRSYSSTVVTPSSSVTAATTPFVITNRSSHVAPVSYLSPLIQCPSPRISGSAHPFQQHALMNSPSEGANIPTPFDSISASSSSLSSNPLAENQPSDGATVLPRQVPSSCNYPIPDTTPVTVPTHRVGVNDSSMSRICAAYRHTIPCTRITLSTGFTSLATSEESSIGATVSVHCQRVPTFYPIPPLAQIQSCSGACPSSVLSSEPGPNRDSLASDALVSTVSPSPQLSSAISTRSTSQRSGKSSRSKSTISDRLPCQLAFSPTSVRQLLEWLITHSLDASPIRQPADSESVVPTTIDRCPLGPAISIYLMLRAIYRQCDRWELIELREALKESGKTDKPIGSSSEPQALATRPTIQQRRRRQRELLTLLASAVEHLQHFETVLLDSIKPLNCSPTVTDEDGSPRKAKFHHVLCSTAAWLANASQLLHLVTRDMNLAETFELDGSKCPISEEESTTYSAWTLVQDQLTDVVQAAFGFLAEICVSRLDRISIPQFLSKLTRIVDHIRTVANEKRVHLDENGQDDDDWASDDLTSEILDVETDAVLQMLTETLNSLHDAHVNPAFVVQLFARLLHRLNARLFNFLLGSDGDNKALDARPPDYHHQKSPNRISPAWGRVLHRWIHEGLCTWAITEGLGVAAECYLQRVSQAAELMLADMSSVEGIYNVAVDLVGLNSRQVRALLQGHRSDGRHHRSAQSNEYDHGDSPTSNHIPDHWIDFVVSGVRLVADRILAEEESAQPLETSVEGEKGWIPRLGEPLDLLLPLLLPEDSYPSDNPIPGDLNEEPVSCDSGICSRPNSAREQRDTSDNDAEDKHSNEPLITVESVRQFLAPAISNGWCRLSVRPICDAQSNTESHHSLCWNVYLKDSRLLNGTSDDPVINEQSSPSVLAESSYTSQPEPIDPPSGRSLKLEPDSHPSEVVSATDEDCPLTNAQLPTSDSFHEYIASLCSSHRPVTVVVPKIGQSLGLSIVAAKSEDGRDLGIYVRAIVSGSGASRARVVPVSSETHSEDLPVLRASDHLLAVNNRSVLGLSQEAAAQLVASAGPEVTLTVVHSPNVSNLACERQTDPVEQASSSCPECQLRACFRVNPVAASVFMESICEPEKSNVDDYSGAEPPPIPSALGPVMHLPHTRAYGPSDWTRSDPSNRSVSTVQESNFMSKSATGSLQSSEQAVLAQRHHALPSSTYTSSVSLVVRDGNHMAVSNIRDAYEATISEYSLGTSMEPSELSFGAQVSVRVPDWPTIDKPCHRPKGQSASFDDWVAASRLQEFCEKFASELETQLHENELMLSKQQTEGRTSRTDRMNHLQNASSVDETTSDACSSLSRPSLPTQDETNSLPRQASRFQRESTGQQHVGGSTAPRIFVPTVSVLPSNANRPAETPKPKHRTNNHSSDFWASKSLGDLASLEQTLSSPSNNLGGAKHPTKTTLQRRHTTLTSNRLNLGPRPEPPHHGSFNRQLTNFPPRHLIASHFQHTPTALLHVSLQVPCEDGLMTKCTFALAFTFQSIFYSIVPPIPPSYFSFAALWPVHIDQFISLVHIAFRF
ncbi:Ras association domain protein [Opisthorchis viverrini]|uniref:Ras association domain protein n=1 Tax=Opisthorchis viverrini TaxID=6198 RepID=A0A1S8WLY5_OPIVI|nr:Ras association domain protein [Opisthorchis viverrini]